MAVDPDNGIAEHAVELDADALAEIGRGNGEPLTIPSNARFGEVAANLLGAIGSRYRVR